MAQNITLLGASYTAVPAVQLPQTGGGTALFTDVSDTTALAADVASGKYFYLATGEKVEGSGSGGGGMVTENIIPQQSLNCSISLGDGAYGAIINSYIEYPQDGVEYLVTFDGTEYICRGHYRSSSILVVGDYYVTAGASYVEFPFAVLLNGGNLFYLAVQGSATHTLKVDKIISYSGGGGSTLIEKSITANGTYNASDDSADGYSKVTVNVSGGVTPAGTKVISIAENGTTTEDVTQYADVQISVNVPATAKNVQTAQSTSRRNNTALGSITSLTCSKAGTYDVYWTCTRSNTSQTWGSQLYINGTAYGTENTTWSNNVQNNHLTGVTIPANATVAVYGRSRSSYYIYAPQLTIVEA